MVRVIYGIDIYEGYAAAKSDTEFWVYDSSYNIIHHVSGIYGSEWNYISIEGGSWLTPNDILDHGNLLEQKILELETALATAKAETKNAEKLVGYLSGESSLIGKLSVPEETTEEIPQLVGYLSIPEHIGTKYDGSYEVVPTTGFQLMDTEEKYMEENVIVHPIPYAEVSNESGGYTATIGG